MKRLLALLALVALSSAVVVWYLTPADESPQSVAEQAVPPGDVPATAPTRSGLLGFAADDAQSPDASRAAEGRRVLPERTQEPALWIEGRVDLAAACASDDSLEVFVLDQEREYAQLVRALEADGGSAGLAAWLREHLLGSARVEPDGSFRVGVAGEPSTAHVFLRGRYLYLERTRSVQTDASGSSAPLVLVPKRGAFVSGRLIAPPGAAPEASLAAEVDCQREQVPIDTANPGATRDFELEVRADEQGRFELRALPVDSAYRLTVTPEGFAMARELIERPAACEELVLDLALTRGASLAGSVVDEGGAAIEGAQVDALVQGRFFGFDDPSVRETKSDERGRFTLEALPAGALQLRARKNGWLESQKVPVSVPAEGSAEPRTLVLTRGGSIAGRVEWPDGKPASSVSVRVEFDVSHMAGMGAFNARRGARSSTETQADGSFRATGLGTGPFVVRASARPDEREASVAASEAGQTDDDERDEQVAEPEEERAERFRASIGGVTPGTEDLVLRLVAPVGLWGRVVDPRGAPVRSYRLRAVRPGDGPIGRMLGQTREKEFDDEDGSFFLAALEAGAWEIEVRASDLATPEPVQVEMPFESEDDPLVVQLVPTATVTGTVRAPDGRPIARAQVKTARGQSGLESMMQGLGEWKRDVASDEQGHFRVDALLPGSVAFSANHADWAPGEALTLELVGGETIADVDLRLRRGGVLTGEVFDARGEVAAGRMITAQNMADYSSTVATADGSGRFRLEHLAPGNWQVIAMDTAGDWSDEDQGGAMAKMLQEMEMTTAKILDGEETHVVLGGAPVDPVRVHGRVSLYGEPYSGALVTFYGEGARPIERMAFTTVGQDGRYEIEIEGHGSYVVSVGKMTGEPGQQSSVEFPTEVPAGPEFRLDLELPEGRVSGLVLSPDGAPLAGARVTLTPDGVTRSDSLMGGQYTEMTTGPDGRYDIPGLRPGVYRVSAGGSSFLGFGAEAPGGRVTRGGLRLGEAQWLADVDFRLEPPGSLEVHVRDAAGAPAAGATIFVRDAQGRVSEAMSFRQTDGAGTCLYSGLAPGEYSAIARLAGSSSEESALVRVRSGEARPLELQLGPGAVLWVRFKLDEGEEVPASLEVLDSKGRDVTGLLGLSDIQELYSEGEFSPTEHRIGPLPLGKYKVRAWTEDGMQAEKNVIVRAGEREQRFTLRLEKG